MASNNRIAEENKISTETIRISWNPFVIVYVDVVAVVVDVVIGPTFPCGVCSNRA